MVWLTCLNLNFWLSDPDDILKFDFVVDFYFIFVISAYIYFLASFSEKVKVCF